MNGSTSLEVRGIARRKDLRGSRFVCRPVADCTLESTFPIYILQSQAGRIWRVFLGIPVMKTTFWQVQQARKHQMQDFECSRPLCRVILGLLTDYTRQSKTENYGDKAEHYDFDRNFLHHNIFALGMCHPLFHRSSLCHHLLIRISYLVSFPLFSPEVPIVSSSSAHTINWSSSSSFTLSPSAHPHILPCFFCLFSLLRSRS